MQCGLGSLGARTSAHRRAFALQGAFLPRVGRCGCTRLRTFAGRARWRSRGSGAVLKSFALALVLYAAVATVFQSRGRTQDGAGAGPRRDADLRRRLSRRPGPRRCRPGGPDPADGPCLPRRCDSVFQLPVAAEAVWGTASSARLPSRGSAGMGADRARGSLFRDWWPSPRRCFRLGPPSGKRGGCGSTSPTAFTSKRASSTG